MSCGSAKNAGPRVAGSSITASACGQRLDDLLGPADAIPVAGDRLEGVGNRDRGVVEVLDLLEHGVDDAVLERVAGEQQHGQPVGMGDRGRRHHVRGARADRRGGDHDPPAPHRLAVGNGGERHRLLVVAAPRRQLVLHGLRGPRRDRSRCRDRRCRRPRRRRPPLRPSTTVRWASSHLTMACAVVSRMVSMGAPSVPGRFGRRAQVGDVRLLIRWNSELRLVVM